MNHIEQIKEAFNKNPSDLSIIRKLLLSTTLTKNELAELAVDFTDNCFYEYSDALDPETESITIENMHSNYIVDAISLLLEFGLDPNSVINGDENVMWNTMWIDCPNVAGSLMKLLLENGGNPNHSTHVNRETLFEYIAFKVSYDEYTHEYFHTFQCWLLLMAYGACWQDGNIPITMLNENSVEIFKDFELYDYIIQPLPQLPGKYGCWIMHIYNKKSMEEVAIYQ